MTNYKIALVLDDTLDSSDGVQQYVLNVGKWLQDNGHEVHYIVGYTERTDIPRVHSLSKNVKVRFNHNRMSMPLPASKRSIAALLRHENFDIIHVQMPYSPFLAGRIVQAAGPLTGVVGTFHIAPHSWLVHKANVLLGLIVRRSLGRFDEILSVSKIAQDFAYQTFGVESSIVPNTIDLTPFSNPEPLAKYKRTMNIMFFGRLVERKGCQHFLKAIAQLHHIEALPKNCQVLVCGKGPMEAQLRQYTKAQGLDDLVTFTGFISETDKPRYLSCADIVAYPSTGGESFGIVLLEGMAAARGVVLAGNNPGYAGVIGERTEALFDPTDGVQFVDRITQYIENPKLRREAADWQKSLVRRFDLPNVCDEILAAYDMALHKRRA